LLLGLVLVSAFTEKEYQDAFSTWMVKFGKSYSSSEFQARYAVFKGNMDFVRDWNADNSNTHVVALNKFADMTNQEYQQIYLGTPIEIISSGAAPKTEVTDTYNSTVDWVAQKGIVTPVKNQGDCGSCWSFSTTGSTEGAWALAGNTLTAEGLSEQNLMDCSNTLGNQGCDGGLMSLAFEYIIENKGIDTEESYPYEGTTTFDCKYNAKNSGATLSSYTNVTSESESSLQTAATKQPVSVAIDAGRPSFQFYSTGVYHDYFCSQTKLDHGVLVVGYGVDETSHQQYWKVKNSWGADWGQQGYIYMSRNRNNNCGIASMASFPHV